MAVKNVERRPRQLPPKSKGTQSNDAKSVAKCCRKAVRKVARKARKTMRRKATRRKAVVRKGARKARKTARKATRRKEGRERNFGLLNSALQCRRNYLSESRFFATRFLLATFSDGPDDGTQKPDREKERRTERPGQRKRGPQPNDGGNRAVNERAEWNDADRNHRVNRKRAAAHVVR